MPPRIGLVRLEESAGPSFESSLRSYRDTDVSPFLHGRRSLLKGLPSRSLLKGNSKSVSVDSSYESERRWLGRTSSNRRRWWSFHERKPPRHRLGSRLLSVPSVSVEGSLPSRRPRTDTPQFGSTDVYRCFGHRQSARPPSSNGLVPPKTFYFYKSRSDSSFRPQ